MTGDRRRKLDKQRRHSEPHPSGCPHYWLLTAMHEISTSVPFGKAATAGAREANYQLPFSSTSPTDPNPALTSNARSSRHRRSGREHGDVGDIHIVEVLGVFGEVDGDRDDWARRGKRGRRQSKYRVSGSGPVCMLTIGELHLVCPESRLNVLHRLGGAILDCSFDKLALRVHSTVSRDIEGVAAQDVGREVGGSLGDGGHRRRRSARRRRSDWDVVA